MVNKSLAFKRLSDQHQWLTSVILAIQETEIRRITVQIQPGQIVPETVSEKTHHKKGLEEWLRWSSTCLASVRP
jgi:hypothetical protein